MASVPPPLPSLPRPPPTLEYASRRPTYSIADGQAFVAGCGLICAATAAASVVGLSTAYVLHEVFVFCFGK